MNKDVLFSRKSDEWGTPKNLFEELNKIYHFTLDPCATIENHKCDKYFTKEQDGLKQNWGGQIVFCNPPYSNIKEWAKKCVDECLCNNVEIVLLVPARTDTKWFHEYIYKKNYTQIEFIKGRLKFNDGENGAPFPSMLVYFKKN